MVAWSSPQCPFPILLKHLLAASSSQAFAGLGSLAVLSGAMHSAARLSALARIFPFVSVGAWLTLLFQP